MTVISRRLSLLFVLLHRKIYCANTWQMLFKLVESLKLHLSPRQWFHHSSGRSLEWAIPLSINKCNGICNMRTWFSYAPPVTVNVNYSCLEASSTACCGFCEVPVLLSGCRGWSKFTRRLLRFEFQRASVDNNLILRWKGTYFIHHLSFKVKIFIYINIYIPGFGVLREIKLNSGLRVRQQFR